MSGPLLILDTATLYYRAFCALPLKMTAPDNSPHNAVRGFLAMLAKLIVIHQPSGLIALGQRLETAMAGGAVAQLQNPPG